MPAINENLKLLRQSTGMTQAEVADAIPVARQTVSSYESGRTQPDLETLKRLAEIYQADLHDVLYGGNRLQRRLNRVKFAVIILVAVLLFGILARSVLFWVLYKFFPISSGIDIAINVRLPLLNIAEAIFGVCSTIFYIGCILMIYPCVSVAHALNLRKLISFLLAVIAAVFICTVPFAIADKSTVLINYLWGAWNGLIVMFLLFAIMLSAKLIKRRRSIAPEQQS